MLIGSVYAKSTQLMIDIRFSSYTEKSSWKYLTSQISCLKNNLGFLLAWPFLIINFGSTVYLKFVIQNKPFPDYTFSKSKWKATVPNILKNLYRLWWDLITFCSASNENFSRIPPVIISPVLNLPTDLYKIYSTWCRLSRIFFILTN